ncbi:hypothetical protein LG299_02710 [Microbacterium lacus]|uniref:hypothetical protein n=1 Tax=Microbacterium lacus TaxID=415217 RepID=UPI00384D2959
MPSALPPTLAELVELGVKDDGNDAAIRAESALADATELALAEVPERTAQTWATTAPELVRLIVIHAARRHTVAPSRGVYLTDHERELVRRAHTPTRASLSASRS